MTNKFFFKYLFLHHAIQAQFTGLTQEATESPLEVLLLYPAIEKLVTTVYSHLQSVGVSPFQITQWT